MSEIDAQIKVTRDPSRPLGEWGAFDAEIYVDNAYVCMVHGATRDEAVAKATERWETIRGDYLADPAPEPEWVKLS